MFLLRRFEAVTDLADGVNEDGSGRIGLDLVPQCGDEAVDAPAGDHTVITPDCVQNLVARQCPAGLLHEIRQQIEFLG